MGIFDKAKDVLNQHPDKIDEGLDRAAGIADQRTGGKHADQIDQGVDVAKKKLGDHLGESRTPPA